MDDPTSGVDVGAKAEFHVLPHELDRNGVGQLLVSSDPRELAVVCDRVLVIRRGRPLTELRGDDLTAHALLEAVNGTPPANPDDPTPMTPAR
jgi:ABC-type sugar transport system ATPase subunit